jgi:hypothetical protein
MNIPEMNISDMNDDVLEKIVGKSNFGGVSKMFQEIEKSKVKYPKRILTPEDAPKALIISPNWQWKFKTKDFCKFRLDSSLQKYKS